NFGHLLAEIHPPVSAANAGADPVSGLKILRPATLSVEKQLPELPLRQQLNEPADRRRGHAERTAARRSRQQHVTGRNVGEGRELRDRLGRLEDEITCVVALTNGAVDLEFEFKRIETGELLRLEHREPRADRTKA